MHSEQSFILNNVWLIPAIPFLSFLTLGLLIRNFPKKLQDQLSGIVATLAVFSAAVLAYWLAWEYFHLFPAGVAKQALVPWSFEWLRYQENLAVNVGVLVDPISVLLMVVVTTVSSLVHLYSTGYMHGDPGYARYFTWLNLFTFSMLGLVVSPNILQMYVCWELVGASSFLLIGFYFEKPSAVSASKKAFIVTRFADLGFLLGVILLGYYGYNLFASVAPSLHASGLTNVQPFDFAFLTNPEVMNQFMGMSDTFMGMGVLT
ncbi:MAG TPA: hypothetical protein DCS07_11160, partial [Bdellovibrionales bacterium]|nr:hypothetical protein [Bdellovibrionales bacterium]